MGAHNEHQSLNKKRSKSNTIASNCYLDYIKSKYILKMIFDNLKEDKKLNIIKNNKRIQNRLEMDIKDYKKYSEMYTSIEIEAIPQKLHFSFANTFTKSTNKNYYHIFINNEEELKQNNYIINNNDPKIKIMIDYGVKSLSKLFENCEFKSINFTRFYRKNITDMSYMFYGCSSLNEINLNNFNTNNVTNMRSMFSGCLDELKLKIKSQFKNIKEEAFKN